MALRKIVLHFSLGLCGYDSSEAREVEDTLSPPEIDELAYDLCLDYAASYGFDMESEDIEGVMENEEGEQAEPSVWWEDFDPEAHGDLL